MTNYYNENDPAAAHCIRALIADGVIDLSLILPVKNSSCHVGRDMLGKVSIHLAANEYCLCCAWRHFFLNMACARHRELSTRHNFHMHAARLETRCRIAQDYRFPDIFFLWFALGKLLPVVVSFCGILGRTSRYFSFGIRQNKAIYCAGPDQSESVFRTIGNYAHRSPCRHLFACNDFCITLSSIFCASDFQSFPRYKQRILVVSFQAFLMSTFLVFLF